MQATVDDTDKGSVITLPLKPKIASAVKIRLTEWENKPIIRVEVIGDSLSSWQKVDSIIKMRKSKHLKLRSRQPVAITDQQ